MSETTFCYSVYVSVDPEPWYTGLSLAEARRIAHNLWRDAPEPVYIARTDAAGEVEWMREYDPHRR